MVMETLVDLGFGRAVTLMSNFKLNGNKRVPPPSSSEEGVGQ